jgi:hypothetical protein
MTSQCSTGAVMGISLQLIDQMNCLDPGIMKSFAGNDNIRYSSTVFPFQQGPATDTVISVVSGGPVMNVNSALRTVPQQYLLFQWYNRGLCNANLAAAPGRSNHNGGLALDIASSDTWRTRMRNRSYIDNVSGEPWHFYYNGAGGKDVRNLSVLAFQQLYNLNFPQNPIDEDGIYGPQTEGALKSSPANGFSRGPVCNQTMQLMAYPGDVPIFVDAEEDAGYLVARVVVPAGIEAVEISAGGEIIAGQIGREHNVFEFILPADQDLDIQIYDGEGRVRGASQIYQDGLVRALPVGWHNWRVSGVMPWEIRAPHTRVIPGTLDVHVTHSEILSALR